MPQVSTQWSLSSNSTSHKSIPCKATYTFHSSGFLQIQVVVSPPRTSALPSIPRCGLRWALPSDYDSVQWLGLGPHEAYPDRKSSAYLGVFTSSVEDLHTPYIFPQECGRRADPR